MSWLFSTKSTGAPQQPSAGSTASSEPLLQGTPSEQNATPASPLTSPQFDFSTLDASKLHPLAGLNDTLEYLTLEDEALNTLPGSETALPSRGWSDDLSYGTGTTYLTCLGLGGAYGIVEGLRNSKSTDSFRLRLNTVLNSVTRRGPFLGNSGGVVAILYNLINSGIGAVRGQHDTYNAVASGFVAGVLFKSTRGLRPALNAGGLAGAAALLWSLGKTQLAASKSAAAASPMAHGVEGAAPTSDYAPAQ